MGEGRQTDDLGEGRQTDGLGGVMEAVDTGFSIRATGLWLLLLVKVSGGLEGRHYVEEELMLRCPGLHLMHFPPLCYFFTFVKREIAIFVSFLENEF